MENGIGDGVGGGMGRRRVGMGEETRSCTYEIYSLNKTFKKVLMQTLL